MMIRLSLFAGIWLVVLTACVTGDSSATPTIVPLPPTAAVLAEDAPPTLTPIPPPSPTPTLTPVQVFTATAPPSTIVLTQTPLPPASSTVEIIATALNVREGPGIDYNIVGTARAGEIFDVRGIDVSGNWLQISFRGSDGWISALPQYVRLESESLVLEVAQTTATPKLAAVTASATSGGGGEGLLVSTGSGGELYRVSLDGSGLNMIAGGVIDPAVSPDGARVAFTRWGEAEFGALFVLDLISGQERVVAGDIRQPKSPTWSPDGRKIVINFQHGGLRDPQPECRVFDVDDGINLPGNITITSANVRDDGTIRICFIRAEDLRWFLREIDVETGEFEDLPSAQYAFSPTWDPNNPWRLVYSGPKGLMQFDVDSRREWPLTSDLRDKESVFSPDGQQLAITYRQHDHWEIYVFDLATGERRRLTKPPILASPQYNSAAPAWSPDGSKLAFVTDRTGSWEIWVMNADGSDPKPLLPAAIQSQIPLDYAGVNERLLNWLP
jgi:hypothetical protein